MKKNKLLSLLASSLFTASILAGCGGNKSTNDIPEGAVQLDLWHTFSDIETKVFEEMVIPLFNDSHPDIIIKPTRMPAGDEFNQQLVQAISVDSAPDLARMDIVDVPRFANLGALQALDGFDGFDEIKAELFEAPMSTNLYAGQFYGLPISTNTKIGIFNKALLEEAGFDAPPTTFEELMSATSIVDEETFIFGPQGIGGWGIIPYFYSLGGTFTNEDYTQATGYLNSDASVAVLEQFIKWNKQGLIGPSLVGGLGTWEGMRGGNYMMIDDGPWFRPANEEFLDEVVFGLLPAGPAGSISTVGGESTVVFNTSEHTEEAFIFAKFLASDEAQSIFSKELGSMPVNTITAEKDFVVNDEVLSVYMEQLSTAQPRIPSPQWSQIESVIVRAFEAAIIGGENPRETLNLAAEQVDALLELDVTLDDMNGDENTGEE